MLNHSIVYLSHPASPDRRASSPYRKQNMTNALELEHRTWREARLSYATPSTMPLIHSLHPVIRRSTPRAGTIKVKMPCHPSHHSFHPDSSHLLNIKVEEMEEREVKKTSGTMEINHLGLRQMTPKGRGTQEEVGSRPRKNDAR